MKCTLLHSVNLHAIWDCPHFTSDRIAITNTNFDIFCVHNQSSEHQKPVKHGSSLNATATKILCAN